MWHAVIMTAIYGEFMGWSRKDSKESHGLFLVSFLLYCSSKRPTYKWNVNCMIVSEKMCVSLDFLMNLFLLVHTPGVLF